MTTRRSILSALALSSYVLALAFTFTAFTLLAQDPPPPPGLPEPGLIVYGRILDRTSLLPVLATNVTFQITGNSEAATVTGKVGSINGQSFYVAHVLFETRSVSGQNFIKTPDTLALTTGNTTYARTAKVDGTAATFQVPATGQFSFGAALRGNLERVNLLVTGKPIDDPNKDTDGDGVPDVQELAAGTNPNDPNSVFKASTDLQPAPGGGFVIKWSSVAGKSYAVSRTDVLGQPFTVLSGSLPATQPENQFTDSTATGPGPFFYRISVE